MDREYPASSWREMLFKQPPVYDLVLEYDCERKGSCTRYLELEIDGIHVPRSRKKTTQVHNPAGITLGDLDQAAQCMFKKYGVECCLLSQSLRDWSTAKTTVTLQTKTAEGFEQACNNHFQRRRQAIIRRYQERMEAAQNVEL